MPDSLIALRDRREQVIARVSECYAADVLDALKGQDVRVHNAPKAGKEEGQFYNNVDMVLSAS